MTPEVIQNQTSVILFEYPATKLTLTQPQQDVVKRLNNFAQNSHYGSFRDGATGLAYVVPASKKLVIRMIGIDASSGTAALAALLYGDDDAGDSQAGAPTNPVYFMGTEANSKASIDYGVVGGTRDFTFIEFEVPTGKFPHIKNNSGDNDIFTRIVATEEDA